MNRVDHDEAVAQYRERAARYDKATRYMESVRCQAIDMLALRPGDTVLDVACGTGKSFALLQERIGPRGRIIGVDISPDMLALARGRVQRAGWENVTLIESCMERACVPAESDALLFSYTHDVLRSRPALDNIFRHAKPKAHVAAAGMKYFPWWLGPLNLLVWCKARGFTTTRGGFARPWSLLADYVDEIEVEPMYGGIAYIARAVHRPAPGSAPARVPVVATV
jgi:demethylmenaquinone methyltransferase/2-methoxy-6-polyprenyl-1,4-benzoquinol methylase